MTDEHALLAAVAANVDDDTPRLVYADWLDDHGEAARAEFIRAQCRLARVTEGDPDLLPLYERQARLLKKHRRDWLPPDWAFPPYHPEGWQRGFVTRVKMQGGRVTADEAGSLAAVPTAERVHLFQVGMTDDELLLLPRLPNLREFSLVGYDELTPRGVARVAEWDSLRVLHLLMAGLDDAGLAELHPLRGLRSLSVMGGGGGRPSVTDAGLEHLAGLPGLEDLHLDVLTLAGWGLGALTRLPRLRRLAVGGCGLTGDALDPLAGCPALEEVDLSYYLDAGPGDQLLASLHRLPHLTAVNALRSDVTGAGFQALAQLTRLVGLAVGGPGFGDRELAALAGLTRLRRLKLSGSSVTPGGLAALSRLPDLRVLELGRYALSDGFVDAVVRLRDLRYLDLGHCNLSNARLGRLRELPHLEVLRFQSTKVSDTGIRGLGPVSPLRYLYAQQTRASKEFVWDRRQEWAPRLTAATLGAKSYGPVGAPKVQWRDF